MEKRNKSTVILPPDTFFYTIPLVMPEQRLIKIELEKHYPIPKGRKAFMGNHYEFKSYKHGIVSVKVNLNDNSENTLFMHVGFDELHIACTCGMPEDKLCFHAYMGLDRICWQGYFDCQKHYWPGYEDEKNAQKFLEISISEEKIYVRPKERFGKIFKPNIGFANDLPPKLEIQHAVPINRAIGNRQVIAYCLSYGYGGGSLYNRQLPTLVPCSGTTSKNDRYINSFHQFGLKEKPIKDAIYTENQQVLNLIGVELYEIAKKYEDVQHIKVSEWIEAKQMAFELWERSIPLLLNERFNYFYLTYWLKYLKDKPSKSNMSIFNYSLEIPVVSFHLKSHQDYYSFSASVSVGNKDIKVESKPNLFLRDWTTNTCYLMRSVQDDELLLWMISYRNRLTILKDHIKEFHDKFLNMLGLYYDVFFVNKSGKKIKYSLDTVLKDTFHNL